MKGQIWHHLRSSMVLIVIPLAIFVAWLIYSKILGAPSNFIDGNPQNEPLQENYMGIIYKGGPIVILLIAFQIILLNLHH